VKVVAETLGVSRSNLNARLSGSAKPRRRYHKAQDAAVLPLIERLVAKRPTYGYRRITALLNRQLRATGAASVNPKMFHGAREQADLKIWNAKWASFGPDGARVATLS
jgi:hypothetical protein